ncbi:hypothetical protein SEMRO_4117_G352990.1 [Seminavis robusta]|uniref:Uncharacterized protein n=1 Tax=Seminavis robusta TaxID=568900 RepID=A0A9N8I1Q2_9STRA|nr:hypothetical protein SEMRO_4117_G352990.1 [Seminavis robusta]|eukprot:Sro4117_g352990.1 n/a (163) ;mRNA; r:2033-2521
MFDFSQTQTHNGALFSQPAGFPLAEESGKRSPQEAFSASYHCERRTSLEDHGYIYSWKRTNSNASHDGQQIINSSSSWDEEERSDDDDALLCNQPSPGKKQRKHPRQEDLNDEGSNPSDAYPYLRRGSYQSPPTQQRQSGHRKGRNRAFTGEDFQRLIISQM